VVPAVAAPSPANAAATRTQTAAGAVTRGNMHKLIGQCQIPEERDRAVPTLGQPYSLTQTPKKIVRWYSTPGKLNFQVNPKHQK
jgi:hypothetical protein